MSGSHDAYFRLEAWKNTNGDATARKAKASGQLSHRLESGHGISMPSKAHLKKEGQVGSER